MLVFHWKNKITINLPAIYHQLTINLQSISDDEASNCSPILDCSEWQGWDTTDDDQPATYHQFTINFSSQVLLSGGTTTINQPGCINQGLTLVIWLVVWNMTFIFPYIENVIIPIDELIFFRGSETTNQFLVGNDLQTSIKHPSIYRDFCDTDDFLVVWDLKTLSIVCVESYFLAFFCSEIRQQWR